MPYVGTTRQPEIKKKGLNPIWRGIGFILLFIVFGGSYWAASLFLDLNRQGALVQYIPVPPYAMTALQAQMTARVPLVGAYIVPGGFALVISIFVFTFLTVAYSLLHGPVTDPRDVRGPSHKRSGRRKIRKCR
ncbi:MAG: hypothetical protein AAB342_03250 [Chloroflexota bacterium]